MGTRFPPFAFDGRRAVDTCALSLKWSFQLLLDLGGHRTFVGRHGFNDDDLAYELALEKWLDDEQYKPALALAALRKSARTFQATHPQVDYPDNLAANLEALGVLLGLSEAELQVLGFCVLMHCDPTLSDATDQLGMLGFKRAMKVLSVLLGLPLPSVETCLAHNSPLIRIGLLEISTSHRAAMALSSMLSVSNQELPGLLRFSRGTPLELFAYAFRLTPPGTLSAEHYSHVRQPLIIAERYLSKVLAQPRPGVNILLYGPPGTGKTQLSRLLAKTLGCALYEVACTDSLGDPVSAKQRLCSLRAANSVLHAQRALLVLDEIEDIFQAASAETGRRSQKGWINRMLEENTLPCFWLSNSIEAIDAAHIRRFDLVIEISNPPLAQRQQMLRECGAGKLGSALMEHLSAHDQVTPAVLERAVRVGRSVAPRASKVLDNTIRCIVDGTLKAQGFEKLQCNERLLPAFYSPAWINADQSLSMLSALEPRFEHARQKLKGLEDGNPAARWPNKVASVRPDFNLQAPEIQAEMLEALQHALISEQQVHSQYYSAHTEKLSELTLNPLAIVQRGLITYLIATAVPYTDVRQFAVHRFRAVTVLETPCQGLETFELQTYLATDALQFGKPEKIQLKAWVSEHQARLIRETPLSTDMVLNELSNGFQVQATVNNTWQLHWWILSLGDSLVVQEPPELRQQMGDTFRRAAAAYAK